MLHLLFPWLLTFVNWPILLFIGSYTAKLHLKEYSISFYMANNLPLTFLWHVRSHSKKHFCTLACVNHEDYLIHIQCTDCFLCLQRCRGCCIWTRWLWLWRLSSSSGVSKEWQGRWKRWRRWWSWSSQRQIRTSIQAFRVQGHSVRWVNLQFLTSALCVFHTQLKCFTSLPHSMWIVAVHDCMKQIVPNFFFLSRHVLNALSL